MSIQRLLQKYPNLISYLLFFSVVAVKLPIKPITTGNNMIKMNKPIPSSIKLPLGFR